MMTPSEPGTGDADETPPKTVRVPVRRGDGIWTHDEHATVDAEHARQWDARLWSDKPPL
jgi:hypothetical protein